MLEAVLKLVAHKILNLIALQIKYMGKKKGGGEVGRKLVGKREGRNHQINMCLNNCN